MNHARLLRIASVVGLLTACRSDSTCVALPCPVSRAVVLTVTAPNAPAGIANLTYAVSGAVIGGGSCTQQAVMTCVVSGSMGTYHIELSAPGYVTSKVDVTVAGTEAGCGTCATADTRQVSITMQPVS